MSDIATSENGTEPAPETRTEVAYIGGGRDITRGYIPEGRLEPQDSILQRFGW